MAQKPNRPIKPMPVQRPLTEQEKQARIMQFLQQRRESFSISILTNVLQRQAPTDREAAHSIVDLSVDMADYLLKKLYPMEEESK